MCLDLHHLFLLIVNGAITGLSYSFLGAIGIILKDEHIDSSLAGYVGFSIAFTGMIGGLVVTAIETKGISVLKGLSLFSIGTVTSSLFWCFFAQYIIIDFIMGGAFGFFFLGLIPLGLRYSIEYNKNIIETLPSGMIFFLTQIFALLFTYPILDATEAGIESLWIVFILSVVIVGLLILMVIKISRMKNFRDFNLLSHSPPELKNVVD